MGMIKWKGKWYSFSVAWPFILMILLFAWVWLSGAINQAREAARATTCRGNFSQIQIAFLNYHETYGSFPPAYLTDDDGKPMHSWRVLILPFIDQIDVYEKYDFNEPWDGLNNRQLANSINNMRFRCPSSSLDKNSPLTEYVVIVGPQTAFPGSRSTSLNDMTDGPENSITLVEITNSDIHWMEPRDLSFEEMSFVVNDPSKPSISSPHWRGPAVVFADKITAYRLDESLRPETLKALTTIAGGEPVTRKSVERDSEQAGRQLAE